MTDDIDFGEAAARRTLVVGDVLCHEGDTDTDVFQIISGSLDVERSTAEGAMVVASLGPGQLVGEVTNAMGGARTATLRATEATEVAVLTQDGFVEWLDAHPDEAAAIAAQARLRLNRTRAAGVLVRLFGLENQAVVDAIVGQIDWITLAPGDVLFEQGDYADAAYLLIAGRLRIAAQDPEGNQTLDIEIGRGEIVGEMGILEDAPRSAGARAIRETTLAMITREAFEALSTAYPTLLMRVFHTIFDRLTHQRAPDDRARVVGLAITAPDPAEDLLAAFNAAVEPFGSSLHLSASNLGQFVHNLDGPGATSRVAEFLHEADVGHDYLLLEGDPELTDWSISVAKQCDRFILFSSANPSRNERALMRAHLDQLTDTQRSTAWIARLHPPGTRRPRESAGFLDDFAVGEVHNVRLGDDHHLARLGRLATGNGRGVVLGGGGAKGLAHIGALKALTEAGIDYDCVGGASIGSLIGALAARDDTPEEMLQATIDELTPDLLDYTVPLVALMKAEKMAKGLHNQFEGWDICDLWLPFYCVSTNLTTASLAVHRRGSLVRAIRASSAIPVALPPVPIDGELHVDGGVLDNVPIATMAADSSIGTIIAIDVSPPGGPAAEEDFGLSVSGFDVLRHKLSRRAAPSFPDIGVTLMSSMLIGSSAAKLGSIDEVDLFLDLDLTGVGLLKFENHEQVVQRGYEAAKTAIASWLAEEAAEVVTVNQNANQEVSHAAG